MANQSADVLIVGGGGAACRAAIAAADLGAQVTMVVKGRLGMTGATAFKISSMSGFTVADGQVDPADSPERHYEDIMAAAHGMADPKLARVVAEEAPLALRCLEGWGVPFEREKGKYLEFRGCFSTRPRTHVIKGQGEIMRVFLAEVMKRNIAIHEDCLVVNLLIQDGTCIGVGALDKAGRYRTYEAGAVVLATGGAGQLFKRNMNPPDICGDGYRLGYDAGAEMINMEFMQAGIGVSYPRTLMFKTWLWSAHPQLTNILGNRFLSNYLPRGLSEEQVMDLHSSHFPFSTSDDSRYLEIAIQAELAEQRGTPEQGINLDFPGVTNEYLESLPPDSSFRKMWPITRDYYLSCGLDLMRQPIQVACVGHAMNGGLRIDEQGGTSIPGLYAAGEVAGGPHGADRLGGNMLVTCQVFGARAGSFAARYARGRTRSGISNSLVAAEKQKLHAQCGKAIQVQGLKESLQVAAQSGLLIRRSHLSLTGFLDTVNEIRKEIDQAPDADVYDWGVWELGSLLCAGEIMAKQALLRRESRGSHFRVDFPQRDDLNFSKPLVTTRSTL